MGRNQTDWRNDIHESRTNSSRSTHLKLHWESWCELYEDAC